MKQLLLLLSALWAGTVTGQVVVNEYSCANVNTLADSYGMQEDWVELYNPSAAPVNLLGYFLSNDPADPYKWRFTGGSVPGNGYLLVFCSGRNEITGGGEIHTSFKLTQTAGESLVFTAPSGVQLTQLTLTPTQRNHSRGRITDGASSWTLFTTPSPGASNSNPQQEYTPMPVASRASGFTPNPIPLLLSSPDPNALIYYTLDGSEPTTGSTLYTTPITIMTSTVVRARAFRNTPGIPPSYILNNTYIIGETHASLPSISLIGTNAETLLNGNQINTEVAVEYFDGSRTLRAEVTGMCAMHDAAAWGYSQRGVDFTAFDEHGYDHGLQHRLFPQKNREVYEQLVLKAAGNDNYPFEQGSAHIRDAFVQTLSQEGNLHLDEETYKPCLLFVNGKYWGVYEMREKVAAPDFTRFYYNQDEYDLQFLKTDGATVALYGGTQAQTDWNDLVNFITTSDMSIQANFDVVDSLLDVKSFADYFILNSFVVNKDWLDRNTGWWRGLNPDGEARKWRYALFDFDATFGHYTNHTGIPDESASAAPCFPEILGNPGSQGHTDMLIHLRQNPDFNDYFINRYIDLTNTVLSCENMQALLDRLVEDIEPEMARHFTRWGSGTVTQWEQNVQALRDFIDARCVSISNGMTGCYNLQGPYNLTITVNPLGAGVVTYNSTLLPFYPWTGTAYGNVNTTLRAESIMTEYMFDRWEISLSTPVPGSRDSLITVDFVGNDRVIAHFKPSKSLFVPTAFSPNGDGHNDFLQVLGEGIITLTFAVYDRWGQLVYQSSNQSDQWDGSYKGEILSSGVYAYRLQAVMRDGSEIKQSGNITLMR